MAYHSQNVTWQRRRALPGKDANLPDIALQASGRMRTLTCKDPACGATFEVNYPPPTGRVWCFECIRQRARIVKEQRHANND